MDASSSSSTETEPIAGSVIALTQSKKDGTPYKRFPDVEAQIAELLRADPATWDPTVTKSEVLVHLIRWLWKKDDRQNIGRLIDCLGRRIARIAKDFTSDFKSLIAEDFAMEIAFDVNEQIFAATPTRQSEFLEVAFRYTIRRRALKKLPEFNERVNNEVIESCVNEIGTDDGLQGVVESYPGDDLNPEDATILAEEKRLNPERVRLGLAAILDSRHREAYILRFLHDWPIFDKDPQVPTLSTHFAMSSRQIQTWLVTAEKQMRTALGEKT